MSDTVNGNLTMEYHPPQDVTSQQLAKIYASALLTNALQRNEVDNVLEELTSLIDDVFQADPIVEEMFAAPIVPTEVKEAAIQRLCEGRASELISNFLQVLNQHGRLELVRLIAKEMRKLIDERARRIRVLVRTALPLPEDQQQRLAQYIHEALNLEPVLDLQVDPELLGGLVVRVLDWQFDGSVRTRLFDLRNQIIERSSHEIQSGRNRFCADEGDRGLSQK